MKKRKTKRQLEARIKNLESYNIGWAERALKAEERIRDTASWTQLMIQDGQVIKVDAVPDWQIWCNEKTYQVVFDFIKETTRFSPR